MHLTQQTDYALRVLIYTAVHGGGLANIAAIAQTYGISKSHLMKVASALVKGGFLTGIRGKGGGLKLARPAETIRVGEVVRWMEPMRLAECFGSGSRCVLTPSCRLAGILSGAAGAFLAHLDGFTLADLAKEDARALLHAAARCQTADKPL